MKSKDQGTDLQCAKENNGSRLKSTTGINYNPKIPYLETKAGRRSDMKHQNGCLHKTHCLHHHDFNHVQGKKLLV